MDVSTYLDLEYNRIESQTGFVSSLSCETINIKRTSAESSRYSFQKAQMCDRNV